MLSCPAGLALDAAVCKRRSLLLQALTEGRYGCGWGVPVIPPALMTMFPNVRDRTCMVLALLLQCAGLAMLSFANGEHLDSLPPLGVIRCGACRSTHGWLAQCACFLSLVSRDGECRAYESAKRSLMESGVVGCDAGKRWWAAVLGALLTVRASSSGVRAQSSRVVLALLNFQLRIYSGEGFLR
jgi:hypothetical protein